VFIDKIRFPDSMPVVYQFYNLTAEEYVLMSSVEGFEIYFYYPADSKVIKSDYYLPQWFARNTVYAPASRNPFYLYNDTVCFAQIYNGDIFNISPPSHELSYRYKWDFGQYNFTPSALPENESMAFYMNISKKISMKYALLFQVYQENSRFYFTRFKFKNRYKHLLLSKHTKTHILFEQFKEGGQCLPLCIDESAIYTPVSPQYINKVINPAVLDGKNKKIYSHIKEDDNPVIIKYILK
jgi:hypothetical protein